MPAPEVLIPIMEATVGSLAGGRESVAFWLRECKRLMLVGSNKDKTDWEFAYSADIDESANNIRTGVGTLYAFLIGYNAATAAGDLLCISDAAANTFDGTAALDSDDTLVYNLIAAATEDTEEFHAVVIPEGKYLATGLTVGADAQGGTNPATDDVRGWFLYRTAA